MARLMRRVATIAVAVGALGCGSTAGATDWRATDEAAFMAPEARLRGSSQRMVAAIRNAVTSSQTFRGLMDQIDRTDGVVYVMEGNCEHGVRACLLLAMTAMGPNRVLWIRIDPRKTDRDLMGSVGHELQHALEVLSHRGIRSGSAMLLLLEGRFDRRRPL